MKTTTRKAEYDADIRAIIAETRAGESFYEVAWSHWNSGYSKSGPSPLFRSLTPNGLAGTRPDDKGCGCLTQVKRAFELGINTLFCHVAWTDEFTRIVNEDPRVPSHPANVTPLSLFAFRDLQMLADATFRRDYLLEQGLIEVIEEPELEPAEV